MSYARDVTRSQSDCTDCWRFFFSDDAFERHQRRTGAPEEVGEDRDKVHWIIGGRVREGDESDLVTGLAELAAALIATARSVVQATCAKAARFVAKHSAGRPTRQPLPPPPTTAEQIKSISARAMAVEAASGDETF